MADLRHLGALTRRPGPAVVVIALLSLLAAGALCVALTLGVMHGRDISGAQRDALATARRVALAVTTYDYRDPRRSRQLVEAAATGAFRRDFAAASPQFYATVTTERASATGTLRAAGVVVAESATATVVAAVDQQVRKAGSTKPVVRRLRLELKLERDHGDWLVAGLRER